MDKNECKAVVELLSVTWNQAIDASSITIKAKGFWEYIEDLPYENVKKLSSTWGYQDVSGHHAVNCVLPCLQTCRDEDLPPEPEEAWTVLQAIGQKIYSGTYDYDKPILC